jgi:hypothetical protein
VSWASGSLQPTRWTGINPLNVNGARVAADAVGLPYGAVGLVVANLLSHQQSQARLHRDLNWVGGKTIFDLYDGIDIREDVLSAIMSRRANRTGTGWD